MTDHALVSTLPLAAAMALGGIALGLAYFACLGRTVVLFADGAGWAGPALLTVGRLAVAAVAFGIAAKFGPAALLAAFLGFLVARTIAVRRAKGAF